jgi:hypothetical protein
MINEKKTLNEIAWSNNQENMPSFIKVYNNTDLKYPFLLRPQGTSSNSGGLRSAGEKPRPPEFKTNNEAIYLARRRELTGLNLKDSNNLSVNLASIDDNVKTELSLSSTSQEMRNIKKPEYSLYIQKLRDKSASSGPVSILKTFSNNLSSQQTFNEEINSANIPLDHSNSNKQKGADLNHVQDRVRIFFNRIYTLRKRLV